MIPTTPRLASPHRLAAAYYYELVIGVLACTLQMLSRCTRISCVIRLVLYKKWMQLQCVSANWLARRPRRKGSALPDHPHCACSIRLAALLDSSNTRVSCRLMTWIHSPTSSTVLEPSLFHCTVYELLAGVSVRCCERKPSAHSC